MPLRPLETHELYTTETSVLICFDFSKFSEVQSGATISAPSTPDVSGVTFGTPEVIASTFTEYKPDGTTRTVASGKGVKVRVTASTAGDREIACTVSESGGGKLTVKAILSVP